MGQKELLLGTLCLVVTALAVFGGRHAYLNYEQSSRKSMMRERMLVIAQNMKKREHTRSFTGAAGSGDGYDRNDFIAVTGTNKYYMYTDHGLIGYSSHMGEDYVIGLLDGFDRQNVHETAVYVRLPDGDEVPKVLSHQEANMDGSSLARIFYNILNEGH